MAYDQSLVEKRDYSLTGPSAARALELGLASAEWYHSDIPRQVMKDLMARFDAPGGPTDKTMEVRQKVEQVQL